MTDLHTEASLVVAGGPATVLPAVAVLLALLLELYRFALRYLIPIRPHQLTGVALHIFVDRGQFVERGVD